MSSTAQESNDQFYKIKLLKQHSLIPGPANRNQIEPIKQNKLKKTKQERFTSVGKKKMLLKSFWIKGNIKREFAEFLKKK